MKDVQPLASPRHLSRRLSGFSFARQLRLIRKELAETLRDRRTIITLVLMPILVYPLLSIVFRQFLVSSLPGTQTSTLLIGVDSEETQKLLDQVLLKGETILERQANTAKYVEPPLVTEPDPQSIRFVIGDSEQELKDGKVDIAVTRGDTSLPPLNLKLSYTAGSLSASLRSYVERRIRAVNQYDLLSKSNESPPIDLAFSSIDSERKPQSLLPTVVPLILLLMTITGAVYPAIDLTAGERERGTLEALVAAPVSRVSVLIAKYVAVVIVAMLTATVNLVAMTTTIYSSGLASALFGQIALSPFLVVELFLLLLLFACFFSAVLLAITSFARSFKEAQAYLIPLMLVTLGPGLLSLSPQLTLDGILSVTPLINVVLLARDVFAGAASVASSLIVTISTLLYAGVALAAASQIFGSDAILYGSPGSWSDLFRRSATSRSSPSIVAALLTLALLFASATTVAGIVGPVALENGFASFLLASAVMTGVFFAGYPIIGCLVENVRLTDGLRLHVASFIYWVAAILLGLSLGILLLELLVLSEQIGLTTIAEKLRALGHKQVEQWKDVSVWMVLFALAVTPAIAEELCFRGYLFRSFHSRLGAKAAIAITSVFFALFHVFGTAGITLERLPSTLIMGIMLGLLAWRSGSVLPGMILHAINNAMLPLAAIYKDQLVTGGWLPKESQHVPAMWLGAALVLATVGCVLLFLPLRRRDSAEPG